MEIILKKEMVLHHVSNNSLFIKLKWSEANGHIWACEVYQDAVTNQNGHYRGVHRLTPEDIKSNWVEELELKAVG